jgi:tetratricopeptide (TPR) repeat protein
VWLSALQSVWHRVSRANRLIETYRVAAQGTSDHGQAHVNWGVALAQLGELQESLSKFERATQLAPQRASAWINWGVALAKLGRLNEAIDKFEKASQLEPDRGSIYMLWGAALVELGDMDKAHTHYLKAISINPKHPEPWINWGVALARQGDYDPAIERFKKALTLKPSQGQVYFLLGAVLAESGQFLAAIEQFEWALKCQPRHDEALYFWAMALFRLGDQETPKALEKIRQALQLNPDRADYYVGLGDILARQGKWDVATANFGHAVKLDPHWAQAHLKLGQALCQLGKPTEAQTAYAAAQHLQPDLPALDLAWGLSLMHTGEWEEATLHLERALLTEPGHPEATVALAQLMAKQGQWPDVQWMLEQALDHSPDNPVACGLMAFSYLEHLDLSKAHRWLEKALAGQAGSLAELPSSQALAFTVLQALLALEDKAPATALRSMRPLFRARETGSSVAQAFYALALAASGDTGEALHKLNETPPLEAKTPNDANEAAIYGALVRRAIALQEGQLQRAHSIGQTLMALDQATLPPVAAWQGAQYYQALLQQTDLAASAERARLKGALMGRLEQTLRQAPTCGEVWVAWLQNHNTLAPNSTSNSHGEGGLTPWWAQAHDILAAGNAPEPAKQAVLAWACQQVITPSQWAEPPIQQAFPWMPGLIEQGLAHPGLNGYLLWRLPPW